jgi:sorbitol-specific phosphotransferase system component IIA
LRLGSIGAQLGAAINEFSTDGTMAQNSNEKVPTQAAVVTFVKNLTGVDSDFSVGGNLTVTGTTTTISSVTVQAKDRNIELGIVSTGSFTGDINAGEADITNVSDTTNLAPGVQVSLTSGGGTVTMSGAYTVQSISGTTVTLSGVFQGSGSATGTVFGAGGATDTTADGGGITLKSSVDRTISWQASNSAWKLSEHADLADGKAYMIDGTTVLSETSVLGCTIATDFDSVTDSAIPTVEAVTEQIDAQVSASSYFLSLN